MTREEENLLRLLQQKPELEREIAVGEDARQKLEVLNTRIRGCLIVMLGSDDANVIEKQRRC